MKSALRIGDVARLIEGDFIVWNVNYSAAAILSVKSPGSLREEKNGFMATGSLYISPNSECEIVARLGERGLRTWKEGGKTIKEIEWEFGPSKTSEWKMRKVKLEN